MVDMTHEPHMHRYEIVHFEPQKRVMKLSIKPLSEDFIGRIDEPNTMVSRSLEKMMLIAIGLSTETSGGKTVQKLKSILGGSIGRAFGTGRSKDKNTEPKN